MDEYIITRHPANAVYTRCAHDEPRCRRHLRTLEKYQRHVLLVHKGRNLIVFATDIPFSIQSGETKITLTNRSQTFERTFGFYVSPCITGDIGLTLDVRYVKDSSSSRAIYNTTTSRPTRMVNTDPCQYFTKNAGTYPVHKFRCKFKPQSSSKSKYEHGTDNNHNERSRCSWINILE